MVARSLVRVRVPTKFRSIKRPYAGVFFTIQKDFVIIIEILGVLVGLVLRCDRHGSGYDIRTGELVDGPGFDNLPTYKVFFVRSYGMMQPNRISENLEETLKAHKN
jgi:hypothetical protein